MTRVVIIIAERFLASKNQIILVILEFGDIGHRKGTFSHTQYTQM